MKKAFLFCMIITAIEFVAAAALYPRLPDLIPIHWNMAGEVDNYGNRIFIFLAPVTSLALTLLLYYSPTLFPKGDSVKKSGKAYPVIMVMTNLLMAMLLVITAVTSLGSPMRVNVIVPIAVGVLMICIGNYLPKVKQNYIMGIRLPWTLASEFVWTKTHRIGGWVFVAIGILFIIGAFLPAPFNFAVPMAGLFVGLAVLAVYSYSVYKNAEGANE